MPFNKKRWAIIVEPTFQYFKSDKDFGNQTITVDYKSIEFPIGFRYSYYINEKSKVFANGSYVFDFPFNSGVYFDERYSDLEILSVANLAFGFGYKQGDRFSLEVRYQTDREILFSEGSWESQYQTIAVIFGYSLF